MGGSQWWRCASSGRPTGPGTGRYYPYEVTNGAGPAREAYRGHADATEILNASDAFREGKGLTVHDCVSVTEKFTCDLGPSASTTAVPVR